MSASELLHLSKLHGLGNDFLVHVAQPTDADGVAALTGDRSALARRVCARHHGVGADGLLTAVPGDAPDRWTMTLHNADGSRAEMSGNGIRCFAQAVTRRLGPGGPRVLHITTDAGERVVTVSETDDAQVVVATVDMGKVTPGPIMRPDGRPDRRRVHQAATFDLGNPHLVLLVDEPEDVAVAVEGPEWEALFADGINVHFVVADGDDALTQVTWERGAGVTEACGTGASAAAAAAHRWGLVGEDVTVSMPGGSVRVQLGDHVILTGPSEWIADLTVHA